jgi:hypothetical protein
VLHRGRCCGHSSRPPPILLTFITLRIRLRKTLFIIRFEPFVRFFLQNIFFIIIIVVIIIVIQFGVVLQFVLLIFLLNYFLLNFLTCLPDNGFLLKRVVDSQPTSVASRLLHPLLWLIVTGSELVEASGLSTPVGVVGQFPRVGRAWSTWCGVACEGCRVLPGAFW